MKKSELKRLIREEIFLILDWIENCKNGKPITYRSFNQADNAGKSLIKKYTFYEYKVEKLPFGNYFRLYYRKKQ